MVIMGGQETVRPRRLVMPVPVFREDCNKYDPGTTYTVTNEEPDLMSSILGNRRFNRIAAVLSSGDVLLSVLLPRCKEVVAVDHSYGSLAAAYVKAVLLDQMGAKGMKEMLFNCTKWDDLKPHCEKAHALLPEELKPYFKCNGSPYTGVTSLQYDWTTLRREWYYLPSIKLERSRAKLDKVQVIHGDITDLGKYGEFGLLYTSNAHEHTTRDSGAPKIADWAPLVKMGGYLLTTSAGSLAKMVYDNWEMVKTSHGVRTSWHYNLYRRVK